MSDEQYHGSVGVTILAVIGVVFTLYLGSELFVPIAFAVVLSIALRPVVRFLKRFGVPASFGSAIIVLGLVGTLGFGGWLLSGPIKGWAQQMPATLESAQGRLEKFRKPMQRVSEIAGKIRHETESIPASQPTSRPAGGALAPPATQPIDRQQAAPEPRGPEAPSELASAVGMTRKLLSAVIEVILLLYLLLATDSLFFRKILKVMPGLRDKAIAADAADEVEEVVLRYLYVISLINLGMGVVVTLVLWWLGLPAPWIWGLACVVLEFIPYLGATVMVGLLTVTALATLDGGWHTAMVPVSYLLITTINNSVVSPYVYGNRLQLNPVAVLVGVLFWWSVWGIPGAFLAVPLVATIKIVTDRVEGWKPVGEFLGE